MRHEVVEVLLTGIGQHIDNRVPIGTGARAHPVRLLGQFKVLVIEPFRLIWWMDPSCAFRRDRRNRASRGGRSASWKSQRLHAQRRACLVGWMA